MVEYYILLYTFCYATDFTMEISTPILVQYLYQYAQKTDFVHCTVSALAEHISTILTPHHSVSRSPELIEAE